MGSLGPDSTSNFLDSGNQGAVVPTPAQIKTALQLNKEAAERDAEFEKIANSLGIDVEAIAQTMIQFPSPLNSRQIVRHIAQDVEAQIKATDLPTFGTSMFKNTEKPKDSLPLK